MARDLHYPVWTTRLDPRTLERLKKEKERRGLTWNQLLMFACDLLEMMDKIEE